MQYSTLTRSLTTAVWCLGLFVAVGCSQPSSETTETTQPAADPISVEITIETGESEDPTTHTVKVPAGATIAEAMAKLPDELQIETSGSGNMTFLSSINGKSTAGSEGWIFYVNDEWANQGIGAFTLSEGDQVRWKYGSPNDN